MRGLIQIPRIAADVPDVSNYIPDLVRNERVKSGKVKELREKSPAVLIPFAGHAEHGIIKITGY